MFYRRILKYLVNWKEKAYRKPLVLRGARQVGKTSAIMMFGQKYFDDIVSLNLEQSDHLKIFKDVASLEEFEQIVEIKFQQKIIPGKTLVFIDEIQNLPEFMHLLRFFYEQRPDIHVIAAGSLLEAKIEREGISFPVGRIEFAYLYPLDFFEYLEALGKKELLEFLRTVPFTGEIPQSIHQQALQYFYEYAMIGGMPEIVKVYLEERRIEAINTIYASLFTSYIEDVYKYSSLAQAKYLTYVMEKAPLFAGNLITYEKFGGGNFRSREMGHAFDVLQKVMLLYQVQATRSIDLPIIEQKKRPKKLIFLDVGLVNYQMGIQSDYLKIHDLNDFYRGRIAEQIVGQNILAQYVNSSAKLIYWAKGKQEGTAELDFCFCKEGNIVGVEVKSGVASRLRSLFSFAQRVERSRLARLYSGLLREETILYQDKKYKLLSIPFYLVSRIFEI